MSIRVVDLPGYSAIRTHGQIVSAANLSNRVSEGTVRLDWQVALRVADVGKAIGVSVKSPMARAERAGLEVFKLNATSVFIRALDVGAYIAAVAPYGVPDREAENQIKTWASALLAASSAPVPEPAPCEKTLVVDRHPGENTLTIGDVAVTSTSLWSGAQPGRPDDEQTPLQKAFAVVHAALQAAEKQAEQASEHAGYTDFFERMDAERPFVYSIEKVDQDRFSSLMSCNGIVVRIEAPVGTPTDGIRAAVSRTALAAAARAS